MTQPIRPDEMESRSIKPAGVIQAFNEMIAEFWDGAQASILQEEVVKLIAEKMNMTEKQVFAKGYLDIEGIYREAGWRVSYDKPDYNEEPYPAFFVFSKTR